MSEERHPSAEDLRALLDSGPNSEPAWKALLHLAEGCETCQAAAREEKRRRLGPVGTELTPDRYDAVIQRVFAKARKHDRIHRKQIEQAKKGVALLLEGGYSRFLEKWPERLWNLTGYQALLAGAHAVIADDPREAAKMAGVAYAISCNLSRDEYGDQLVLDFQARAVAEYANALRAGDRLAEAETEFGVAFELAQRGTGSPWLHAHILFLAASLHGSQRRFSLAYGALDAAHGLFTELGDRHCAGKVLIKKALYAHLHGHSEVAVEENKAGLALIDPREEPKLAVIARYNQAEFLAACGQYREAERQIFDSRRELETGFGRVEKLKLKGLEAKIDAGLGRFPSSERRFVEARDGFARLGMKFHAVLMDLELAHLLLRQERTEEAAAYALEAEQVFHQLQIHREMLVAVATLAECFRQRLATPAMVEDVISFVVRAEHNPDEKFEIRRS